MTTVNPSGNINCCDGPFYGFRRGNNFAFVLVLFILLVIVGAAWF
ncbi:MAG TPA: YjcZ family sporulation protein [Acholeplasmataceae bacterium]|nr:YjcZ family sporulation protein [Acholeplasmataceae bacterium]